MTSEKAIENILEEQIDTYKVFHDLLKKERTYLVNIEAEKLEEISKEKDTVIMRLRLLEEERQRLTKKFVDENDFIGEISLQELGTLTGNSVFKELRSRLLSLLQSIEEMNKFNSTLIDRSLNYIKTSTSFITTLTKEETPQTTGVLLSKET
jgi:flagellar biosynthesis/type III secretory pathway chaperone